MSGFSNLCFGLWDLSANKLGQVEFMMDCACNPIPISDQDTASFTIRLDNPLVPSIVDLSANPPVLGDVLLTVFDGLTCVFCGDLVTAEENGDGYSLLIDRQNLLTKAYATS